MREPGYILIKDLGGGACKLEIWRYDRRGPSVNTILHPKEVSDLISELWKHSHGEEFERKGDDDSSLDTDTYDDWQVQPAEMLQRLIEA